MVFNVHPGLVVDDDGFGIFVQDNLLVTPSGAERWASFRTGGGYILKLIQRRGAEAQRNR